ncbi:adenylyltransferase/cytidyltransferase family protein [Vibrio parahaemolyticus]|nr:adenylyltransferase/cytidyltransferase family protein [Vibrio parahaemolyticus]EII5836633.1 adenylyltransferase/cytidyltransferase family protein [Vibrio parahaemolyticus]EKB1093302.1 adenylyltransferase/cytidyltransferase family protein [Vibrio parahaemolyticus]
MRLLKRLQSLGDKLVVGLSTDEFNRKKGKQSFFSYNERSEILRSCKYVDDVFPEENWDQKKDDILKYKANIFAMGDDWKGKFDELNDICEVVYLPRTKEISTTEIKRKLSTIKGDDLDKIENSLHTVIEIVKSLK